MASLNRLRRSRAVGAKLKSFLVVANIIAFFFNSPILPVTLLYTSTFLLSISRAASQSAGSKLAWQTSPPVPPNLISPPDGATDQPTSLTLLWNASPLASTYHLQLATDTTFASLILDDSTLADTSRDVGLLTSLTGYYWRVSAANADGTGGYSAPWKFYTDIDTLSIIPGAKGWGITTVAGSGRNLTPISTTVYRVTNLNPDGVGSLRAAVEASGPRVVIFDVSGTIEITDSSVFQINNPFITIAGQTSPSPGITIRGVPLLVKTHDVLVQHVRIRVGDGSGPNPDTRDGISIDANSQEVYNVVIDHCSVSWAIDENLSFAHGTHNATVMNSIISEGLHNSLHSEGPHSKGILVARAQNIGIVNNIMVHNYDRNPILGKAVEGFDVTAAVVNNIMYDWGNQATVINATLEDTTAKLGSIVGNVYISGNSTRDPDPITITPHPNTQLYLDNNTNNRILPSDPWDLVEGDDGQTTRVNNPPVWPNGFTARDVTEVEDYVLANAGARPVDRDPVDERIIGDVQLATGLIIDSQDDVGGWPVLAQSTRILTLPINPNGDDDGDSYTNLEEWLHNHAASVEPILGAPFSPRLLSPSQSATAQPTSLTFEWSASSGATSYRFQLATDSIFVIGIVMDDSTLTDTFLVVDLLSGFTRFYWRVRAGNGLGTSAYTAARNFRTIVGAATLSSPTNGTLNQPTTMTFQWNASLGATTYHVQVAIDSAFTTPIVNDSTLVDTFKQVDSLLNFTTYYWRVRARNAEGMSAYSDIWRFTTVPGAPSPPTLASPSNGATNQSVSPMLKWNTVDGATMYRLQAATDSNFVVGIVLNDSSLVDTLRVVGGLSNNTTYYWRVSAENLGGTSQYSAVWRFTTVISAPTPPVLVSPVNGLVGNEVSVPLLWYSSATAATYGVQVATDSAFTGIVLNDSSLTDTTRVVTNLQPLTTYYWRVNATNVGGTSSYSTPWSFRTLGPPTMVTLLSPANNAVNQPVNITFRWHRASDQTQVNTLRALGEKMEVATITNYWFEAVTDTVFLADLIRDTTLTDTMKSVIDLGNSTDYYWRVKAQNEIGWGAFSPWWTFTTVAATPSAPTLVSPPDGARDVSTTPVLKWNMVAGAATYRLQVATDSTFVLGIVLDDSSMVDTSRLMSQLEHNTKHFWRVNAKKAGGSGPWSVTWNFATIVPLPSQIVLVSPSNGAVIGADTARFLWFWSQPSVSRYWFEKAVDSLFVNTDIDSMISDTTTIVRHLLSNTYWWKVRAYNAAGWGPFSETRQFSVLITDVNASHGLPREFSLSQNYPNPFNPSTVIAYSLPYDSRVELAVFNYLGQQVALLVDEQMDAGYHRAIFKNSGLASGVYLYRLRADHFSATKKLVLLR
ncbi:MAG: T9SS type A sorting domain-containing protein [Ignavibacteria bacterium]|nr:T9SS type A sorting domain-containing protein [Ignavibacteria bacterium]